MNVAQPDVTLYLDMEGVIHDVHLSNDVPSDDLGAWRGRAWADTVADAGGDKVRRMIEDARTRGVSAFRLVNQIFPGGLELPIEYTAVRLGRKSGLVAVGKNLQAQADLQSRLIAAQQAMERDYWKLRDVETRYRLVFDTSTEPFLLVRASNLHILEANPAAVRTLGFSPAGREFLAELPPAEREPFEAMLSRVREQGKAPAVLVHLGRTKEPWLIRATLMTAEPGHAYMLQLAKVGALPPAPDQKQPISSDYLFETVADGMIVTDKNGVIRRTNPAFLDLVQVGSEGSVVGENLGRWLERPGADERVLLANVRKYGLVRLFSTTILGDLGIRTEVEVSAAGSTDDDNRPIVMVLRNVGQRLPEATAGERLSAMVGTLIDQVGKTKLHQLVKDTVGAVERHYVEAALELTDGNRTAAAELLGLSRQSLYSKLNRYGLHRVRGDAADRSR